MASSRSGRILALDYGEKRIGLALSDEPGVSSNPLAILQRKNRAADLRELREIARKNGVTALVVGLPLHLNGSESEMAAKARAFAERLRKHLGLPVELFDERLTSWEASQHVSQSVRRGKKPSTATRDDVAAAILLRDYLEARNSSGKNFSASADQSNDGPGKH
ncbi:MAG TPA: Holliday junction resolvase RuvX [Candidatus Acidoferrales bacterium]|nr:Holliday junction resolvase RuvX [Candidatus Acidoferrales bacterium]